MPVSAIVKRNGTQCAIRDSELTASLVGLLALPHREPL